MHFRTLSRTILATLAFGVALSLLAQGPPLPGLEVRIATEAPPPLRHERREHRPGRDYLWVNGSWDWQDGHWAWVRGRWERSGERGVTWVGPRYVRLEDGYRYEPGHWSNQRLIVNEDVRRHREWREHHRDHDRDHDSDRDHDPS